MIKKWLAIVSLVFIPILVLSYFYLDRLQFIGLFTLYGLLSLGRIIFQVLASRHVLKGKTKAVALPPASLIVAVFNEDLGIFQRALESFKAQEYAGLEVIIVDDGSDDPPVNEKMVKEMGFKYFYQDNLGKREAMYQAFSMMKPESEIVLTADSDTVWQPDAAAQLVRTLLSNKKTGAVTGFVDVLNPNDNLLTRLIYLRYYMAFNQERAAQSLFGSVVCVSGPLGAYRRHLIDKIKERFVTQSFLGKPCTFGDDRHLTNLVLGEGYRVRYSPAARCLTDAPVSLQMYIRQQARWGKSHWREMLWQLKALPKQSIYLAYDWMVTLLLPFLLTISIVKYVHLAVIESPKYLIYLFATMLLMSLIRIIQPIIQTKNPYFVLFTVYSIFHLFVLLPLKFYSLFSVTRTHWGTRKAHSKA